VLLIEKHTDSAKYAIDGSNNYTSRKGACFDWQSRSLVVVNEKSRIAVLSSINKLEYNCPYYLMLFFLKKPSLDRFLEN